MVKSDKNPGGTPLEIFDQIRESTAKNRPQYYQDFTLPFYGYNRPGAEIKQGVRDNWWRQAMMGGIKAQYDCIKAFSETDFTDERGRSDRAVRECRTSFGQASQECDNEILSWFSAWHAD